MVGVAVTLCSIVPGFWWLRRTWKSSSSNSAEVEGSEGGIMRHTVETTGKIGTSEPTVALLTMADAEATDPGLLKKHSQLKSFKTSRFTYSNIRVFYRRHPQADKLPTPPLPLLVFIHGLGGSTAQFGSLLTSLVNLSSCLAIDLPGCGRSAYEISSWSAYTTDALVELLEDIISEYRAKETGQNVVLLGHSMGASLAARLATRNPSYATALSEHVVGLVAICPKAEPPSEEQVSMFRILLWVLNPVFDLWRQWDRRGGTESASVRRFVGEDASQECKKLQFRFNEQSRTAVWRRMAAGSLPTFENGVPKGGLPGKDVWAGLGVPVFLVGGEMDNITKPAELAKIAEFLGKSHPDQVEVDKDSQPIIDSAAPVQTTSTNGEPPPRPIESIKKEISIETDSETSDAHEDPSTPNEELSVIPPQPAKPRKVLKRIVLPAPATHALLYQPTEVRVLAGLISDFLSSQITPRLGLGWQLQFLAQNSKWDVKNLAKWQKVAPVSDLIAGTFRAMKTLREVDE
jgi:pimeloyl-ACP methyl ester carboxylesterase